MRCPKCDANVNDTSAVCGFCGQDLSIIHYVRRISNTYYNMGLEKAKVRDLSGAVVILKKSLQFNKKNTDARNLLGLVYYEMGETVAALSEWVLSKYLQPEENLADYYINTIQKNQTALDATNQTIKKYNAALAAAKGGNEDLAIIQLRKVVSLNPHFVRAQQLLALLYIHIKDYSKAAKCLNRARKVDFNNTTTLKYLHEISTKIDTSRSGSGSAPVKKSNKKDPLANVTPVGAYKEEKKSMMPVVYTIIGAIIGIVVCFVLIRPTLNKAGLGGASDITDANNDAAVQSSQISSLEKEKKSLTDQVDQLKKQIESGDTEAQTKLANYEKLMKSMKCYLKNDKVGAAAAVAGCKKSDFDSAEAKSVYSKIGVISKTEIASMISQGRQEMYTSYDRAIATFKNVLKLDTKNQEAMMYLGRCYMRRGDTKNAKKWLNKAVKIDAGSSAGAQAQSYLNQIG